MFGSLVGVWVFGFMSVGACILFVLFFGRAVLAHDLMCCEHKTRKKRRDNWWNIQLQINTNWKRRFCVRVFYVV